MKRTTPVIRDLTRDDLDVIHPINEACVPEVNSVEPEALWQIAETACEKLAYLDDDGTLLGFVFCLDHDSDYASVNYRWMKERYARFSYVDRVAFSEAARGKGAGQALYRELIKRLEGRYPVLTCEVNERPPNPGSTAFHKKMGFNVTGHAEIYDGRHRVAYFARPL